MLREDYFRLWDEVLRRPESKKEQGQLENIDDPNSCCCLGHLVREMVAEGHVDIRRKVTCGKVTYDDTSSVLPSAVSEKLGVTVDGAFKEPISVPVARVLPNKRRAFPSWCSTEVSISHLPSLNDNTDFSLNEIADVIKEQFAAGNFL